MKRHALILFLLFLSQPLLAEEAYRWTDESGRIFYGSNPPSKAKREPIHPKTFSTYSSERMLKGFGYRDKKESKEVSPAQTEGNKSGERKVTSEEEIQDLIPNQNPKQSLDSELANKFDISDELEEE